MSIPQTLVRYRMVIIVLAFLSSAILAPFVSDGSFQGMNPAVKFGIWFMMGWVLVNAFYEVYTGVSRYRDASQESTANETSSGERENGGKGETWSKYTLLAVLSPFLVGAIMGVLGITPIETRPLEGPFAAEGATIEYHNQMYYVILYASVLISTGLMYFDMNITDGVKSYLGRWRYIMMTGTALFYFPVFWYVWEKRKFTRGES